MLFDEASSLFAPPSPPMKSSTAASSSSTSSSPLEMSANSATFLDHNKPIQSQTSSRILYDIPCKVCTDHSSGKHYGIFACDGCAGFFKRSIRRNRQYVCKAKTEGDCLVDKTHRNQCRACRLKRCISVGMNREAVQHERGPRNSTLRRQMSLYFKEHQNPFGPLMTTPPAASSSPPSSSASARTPSPPQQQQAPIPPHRPFECSPKSGFSIPPPPPTAATASPTAPVLPLPFPHPPPPPPPPHFLFDPRAAFAAAALANSPFNRFPPVMPPTTGTLLMPTPKYPHQVSPASSSSPPSSAASTAVATTTENLSETAARLLFMNVRWAQHVPAFTSLPYRDQMSLLEETWRELFVLSAAQFALPVEMALLTSDTSDVAALTELKAFQETIAKFQSMAVDATEYACLRALVLLRTSLSESRELRDLAAVTALQDQAQLTLSQYISKAYPNQPQRFGKLLLLLPALRASISPSTVHSVFFKCIGAIPLEKIICDMFKARAV